MLNNADIHRLLNNMVCSDCGIPYTRENAEIVREESGLCVVRVHCNECCKCFALAILGLEPMEIEKTLGGKIEDAHDYFQNADENWKKFIAKKN